MRKLLDGLAPKMEMLDDQQAQFIWTNEVKEVKAIVKNVIQSHCKNKGLYGVQAGKFMKHSS